ncbi:alcohol dehydrogenase [Longimycelium tulufanense]|uniref:Alcohol dehydrogenase n=1 Tax=Longimycelium tulufanense TaxID=907463 RepID=A0A8J3C6L0_9PSEU|nr:phosphonoacetaldehyde reductase [Longimycelium tulufanense]GGM41555.1 alcohol dehydrogenase [Longimycelium tulufanense]
MAAACDPVQTPDVLPGLASADLRRLPGHPAAFASPGALGRLPEVLDALGARRVLVVHGGGAFRRCGAEAAVVALEGRLAVRRFGGVRPNPDLATVEAAVAAAREFRPDAVVGIGGGSSLDVAKSAAALYRQPAVTYDCLRDPALLGMREDCALVLVPTTSGSGSELTSFATVYIGEQKYSLDHPALRSDVALVDPDLTASLPSPSAVASGLDALSQAIESYWAAAATAGSRQLAQGALQDLFPALGAVAEHGSFADPQIRGRLAVGAALSGAAINQTRTTAAHALSYSLTARLGITHGVAVALHLRWLLGYNEAAEADDCRHPDGPERLSGLVSDVQERSVRETGGPIEPLLERLLGLGGYPQSLADLRLAPREWAPILDAALDSGRAGNNPRVVTVEDALAALSS